MTPYLINSPEQPPRGGSVFAELCSRDLSLCQYLSWYFSPSTRSEGVQTPRKKLFNSNWSSLKRVLDLILRLAREDGAESRSRINDWIAEQTDSIIIKKMKRDVMGQIAFACNRRNNAMQHRTGLMTLACGTNDRLTTFLYELDEGKLKESGSNKYFHVTVDGLLHGTFGYAHIQNGDIAGAYNLRAYSAHQASLPRVISNISSQLPDPTRHV
ncbi:BQ5605_C014g07565 [Microbotryum silenes-dioicae]|uniref:BQ5605_C014g07565 protein n=1 Tax=Microbotryum silenes-dioicae TaxID=796604 RepID=A0A2X0LTW9_9BASI|nr:BQ5605_C014g07565 [Microbotryum silenes-dioicae]